MKIFNIAAAVLLSCLLLGCGARVLTTTGANGSTLNSANVFSGTILTLNTLTGELCIDSAGSGGCSKVSVDSAGQNGAFTP